jgi:hypothetical protein
MQAGDSFGRLHVYDLRMAAKLARVQAHRAQHAAFTLAVAPQGRLASGVCPSVTCPAGCQGEAAKVACLLMTGLHAAGGLDGAVKLWDVAALARAPPDHDFSTAALHAPPSHEVRVPAAAAPALLLPAACTLAPEPHCRI